MFSRQEKQTMKTSTEENAYPADVEVGDDTAMPALDMLPRKQFLGERNVL